VRFGSVYQGNRQTHGSPIELVSPRASISPALPGQRKVPLARERAWHAKQTHEILRFPSRLLASALIVVIVACGGASASFHPCHSSSFPQRARKRSNPPLRIRLMGNSLSETQAQKLADHFDRVTLMLDGDRPDAKPP
jgi:hypothetical protein